MREFFQMKAIVASLILFGLFGNTNAAEQAITQNIDSPHVKFKSINIGDTRWTEGFWADKVKLAEQVMVPHMGALLTGDIGHAYDNFKVAAGLQEGEHLDWPWHDGDFYKWMESSMYIYVINQDKKILTDLDEYIDVIGKAQLPNGYISTFNIIKKKKPWSKRNHHELYNSGHLITSAIMHKRITGQDNFLNIAIKHANYLYDVFQPRPAELVYFGFNPSQIMALVELYRETSDQRYLELAGIFIDMRGAVEVNAKAATVANYQSGDMVQERTPLREESDAVGHAVLAMYLYAGAADVYAETGEKALLDALKRVWASSNERKMYIHGGLGQADHGATNPFDAIHEGFVEDYVMPNSRSYSETCANVANAMFNWRLLGILGEAKFADNMETVLFNSALSGISLTGTHYFYTNPLRKVDGVIDYDDKVNEAAVRQAYLRCFCCPPNLVRTIAKLSSWAYSLTDNGVAVNLYGGNQLETTLLDGTAVALTQKSQYPWNGLVEITIDKAKSEAFDLLLRIPSWAHQATVNINGTSINHDVIAGEFVKITRQWRQGDKVSLLMPMDIKLIESDPRIEETRNQVAIQRGPLVYALETTDLPEGVGILDAYIHLDTVLEAEYSAELLGGITVIKGEIQLRKYEGKGMYKEVSTRKFEPYQTQFIPYFSWSNRGESEMTIFLPIAWNKPAEKVKVKRAFSWWPF